jgi:hypothetical protein
VAHRDVPGQAGEHLLVEHLTDQPEVLEHQHLRAVRDRDAGGLLAAVLERVKAEVGQLRDLLAGCPDAEDAALLTRFVGFVGRAVEVQAGHGGSHLRRSLSGGVGPSPGYPPDRSVGR